MPRRVPLMRRDHRRQAAPARGGGRARLARPRHECPGAPASISDQMPGVVSCRGLRPDEWAETHGRFRAFIDQWGVRAHEAGWDTLCLFGMGPETGAIRGGYCGVLIPVSIDIHEFTPEWIKLGKWTAFRQEPTKQPGMIPIWEASKARP
jgi:hypothetical protein